jgi:hypothetical protein
VGTGGSLTLGGETAEEHEVSKEERVTTSQIIILRTEHNKQNASLKKSSKELKKTRTELGVYLYHLKKLLAKTGRNGRWTSFLLLMQLNDESPYSEIEAPTFGALLDRYIKHELRERYSTRKSHLSNIRNVPATVERIPRR